MLELSETYTGGKTINLCTLIDRHCQFIFFIGPEYICSFCSGVLSRRMTKLIDTGICTNGGTLKASYNNGFVQ